jgi:hypothetical protein
MDVLAVPPHVRERSHDSLVQRSDKGPSKVQSWRSDAFPR